MEREPPCQGGMSEKKGHRLEGARRSLLHQVRKRRGEMRKEGKKGKEVSGTTIGLNLMRKKPHKERDKI